MRIVILGGGGHGKVVADLVRACGHQVVGFVDRDASKLGREVEPGGARVLYTEDDFFETLEEERDFDAVALAVGDNTARLRLYFELMGQVEMPPLIHPGAVVSPSADLGEATVAMAGVVVNAAAAVGRGVILNTACVVEHDCVVGDGAHVSPNATLAGTVSVGERAWIGAGAVVINNRTVGPDAIVGAGAVVIGDIDAGVTAVGTPAAAVSTS
jgi:UDP-N-acetylbacillosamine N-acetyltransferase